MDLDLDQIEGDPNPGLDGQILVYDGQMMQWQYPVTWTSSERSRPATSTGGSNGTVTVWE